ncbi:MAG: ATP-binding cassette domain-containing protein, partial [Comamonadaceae bacterium]|nr:ATP-binding cassette domain-containing protein [Comamonadaceae bacterium]
TKARQAQSRVKALERMEKIAPVLAEAEFQFAFREPPSLPNPMLAISDASFGYRTDEAEGRGAKETVILRGVNRSVLAGQRIGILGANGQGKSTFVKTIARTLPLLAGKVTEGKGLSIGYFAQQELDVLHPHSTPLEHMVRLARETGRENAEEAREQQLRNFLGGFHFAGEMAGQPVGQFSGGEKARLVLAMLVWQRPNLLLLDEPTNHLDLATREALAVALNGFEGTLMLVSHDRALLRSVCDEFWLVAAGGVQPFDGDLADYQRYLLDEARRRREAAITINSIAQNQDPVCQEAQKTTATPSLNPAEQRRQQAQRRAQLAEKTKPLKRELSAAEARMTALNERRATLEAQLATPLPPAAIADAGRELKSLGDELAALEEKWLDLSTRIEQIEAEAG